MWMEDIEKFIQAIANGECDDNLVAIRDAFDKRWEELKTELNARVKELFGPDAYISTKKSNPFLDKRIDQVKAHDRPLTPEEVQEEYEKAPTDSLSHLDEVEARLNEGQPAPLDQRGAIISGRSAHDMGE